MCGIAGIMSAEPWGDAGEKVREMCALLQHRGPDDTGFFDSPKCTLGQTRLSIIDLVGGHQPMANEDGTVWISFNGEIYNFLELRQEPWDEKHQWRTKTDTEVIVHLYEEFGIGCLEKLNGMFAIALWDERRQTGYLARDRLGIKPLYYVFQDGNLFFASELKALLALPGVGEKIDFEALAAYLTLAYIPEPCTPFAGVRKLGHGSYLEFQRGKLREERYWCVPRETPPLRRSVPDLVEEIAYRIEDATRLQLRADVPVGLFSSGGIDSTSIMWAASRQNVSLEAFLVEFDHLDADTPYARLASAATKMNLTEQQLSSAEAGKLLPHLIWHLDEPLADPAMVPAFLVAREAAKRVKVILNGTGGDEIFGGYHRYNLRNVFPGEWPSRWGKAICSRSDGAGWRKKIGGRLDYRERFLHWLSIFPERSARAGLDLAGAGQVEETIRNLFARYTPYDPAGSMMYVDLHLYLPYQLLMLLDKMTMAASLEARVPLLDHRLVELMAAVPGDLKMKGKELKWLLRRALRGRVPDQILDRPKQGFGPPISKWMEGRLGTAAMKLLTGKRARLAHLLDPRWTASWFSPEKRRDPGFSARIWALLVLELWWRIFMEKADFSGASVEQMAEEDETRWI